MLKVLNKYEVEILIRVCYNNIYNNNIRMKQEVVKQIKVEYCHLCPYYRVLESWDVRIEWCRLSSRQLQPEGVVLNIPDWCLLEEGKS